MERWIHIIVRFTDRMRIVIVCASSVSSSTCERVEKKKVEERDNSEFVTSNGHFLIIGRYFIFALLSFVENWTFLCACLVLIIFYSIFQSDSIEIIEIIALTRVYNVIFITCLSPFTFKKILLEGKMVSFINLTHVDTPYHRWTLFNVSCWLFIAFHALLARFFNGSDET